jgi:hypothetical protein
VAPSSVQDVVDKKNLLTLSGIEPHLLGHLVYSRSVDWAIPDRNIDMTMTGGGRAAATTTTAHLIMAKFVKK